MISEDKAYINVLLPIEYKQALTEMAADDMTTVSMIGARIIMKSEEVKVYVEKARKDSRD